MRKLDNIVSVGLVSLMFACAHTTVVPLPAPSESVIPENRYNISYETKKVGDTEFSVPTIIDNYQRIFNDELSSLNDELSSLSEVLKVVGSRSLVAEIDGLGTFSYECVSWVKEKKCECPAGEKCSISGYSAKALMDGVPNIAEKICKDVEVCSKSDWKRSGNIPYNEIYTVKAYSVSTEYLILDTEYKGKIEIHTNKGDKYTYTCSNDVLAARLSGAIIYVRDIFSKLQEKTRSKEYVAAEKLLETYNSAFETERVRGELNALIKANENQLDSNKKKLDSLHVY